MRQTIRIFRTLLIVILFGQNIKAQVASTQSNLLASNGILSFRPMDILTNPQTLMKVWIDEPMPLSFYTPEEKSAQEAINKKTTDGIMTYLPLKSKGELTNIDSFEITPYTWKWVDLELVKPDSTITEAKLRRPHWWIKEVGADSIGKQVYLDMPELGSQGWATVKAIRVNQLDTRLWDENRKGDYVSRPITGFFTHISSNIYKLYFGNNPEPLLVTGSHPIWSIDKNYWTASEELIIGEKVKTKDGEIVLTSKEKIVGTQKVYNLEVYKDHNFLVSNDKILVHNNCDLLKMAKKYGLNASSQTTQELLGNFGMKASEWIGKYRKGNIKSVLGDVGEKTIGEVFDAADSQTRKMLLDGRFKK